MQQQAQVIHGKFQKPWIKSETIETPSLPAFKNLPKQVLDLAEKLLVLSTSYPSMGLTADRVLELCHSLKDLTQDQLSRGIKGVTLAHKEMFPGTNIIAQIRKYAFGHDQQESAGQAWGKVIKVLKNPEMVWVKVKVSWSDQPQLDRTEKQPDFKSKLIEETVRVMGGLKRMREEEAENPAAVRAHFFRIYEELQEKKNIRELLGEH